MDIKQLVYTWWIGQDRPTRDKARELYRGLITPGFTKQDIDRYIPEFRRGEGIPPARGKCVKPMTDENFITDITQGKTIDELMAIYDIKTKKTIDMQVARLRESGYNIVVFNGSIILQKNVIPQENTYEKDWKGESVIKFGVVSDTHLCSKYQQLTYLKDIYNIFAKNGIRDVYHAGDLSGGYNKRRADQMYGLIPGCIGADEQTEYIVNNYPKIPGITTHFITGNHDHWHINNGGVDIGKRITKEREDMNYLGLSNVTVDLTPNCRMEINHPLDGSAYALSYSIQKYMDSMPGGEKPNILLNGHHHKAMYLFYRNIHALECGTFEAQTLWMKGKRIAVQVGGFMVTVHVDKEGTVTRFAPEFIPYYRMYKDDY